MFREFRDLSFRSFHIYAPSCRLAVRSRGRDMRGVVLTERPGETTSGFFAHW